MLISIIKGAQAGDESSMLFLVEKFAPLVKKYARKLNYEDAYSDLQLSLIELILIIDLNKLNSKNDGALVNYISRSMYHIYCRLIETDAEVKNTQASVDLLIEKQSDQLSTTLYAHLEMWKLPDYPDGLLTEREHKIVRLIYEMGYSAAEISREMNVSRQCINQCKKRAEQKLKRYYEKSQMS